MSSPDHSIEEGCNDGFVVKVGNNVAGFISEDAERPELWVMEDPGGCFMGRAHQPERGAVFLAAWFNAVGQERQ